MRPRPTRRRALKDERPLRILDFGCGTGWLGASLTSFGDVTGIDLSPAAIEHGRKSSPSVHLIAGSFTDEALVGPFDLIISSDVIAHVSDQRGVHSARRRLAASRWNLPLDDSERICVASVESAEAARSRTDQKLAVTQSRSGDA